MACPCHWPSHKRPRLWEKRLRLPEKRLRLPEKRLRLLEKRHEKTGRPTQPWPSNVDGRSVQMGLDMGSVEFFDYLDAGAAIFRDLVDIGSLHQTEADVCVPQAIW